MTQSFESQLSHLPDGVQRIVPLFLNRLQTSFGADLRSIILFGSAAEGAFRATSDVNLLVVLKRFTREHADEIRESYRLAESAVQLHAMFLLERELSEASEQFGIKFADILRRRKILYGDDPFTGMTLPRDVLLRRANQVLLNLLLRLRSQYISRSLREEQAVHLVADSAGPLRSVAAAILELEGRAFTTQKEALRILSSELKGDFAHLMENISRAREDETLQGEGAAMVFQLLDLTEGLHQLLHDRLGAA